MKNEAQQSAAVAQPRGEAFGNQRCLKPYIISGEMQDSRTA
jgi:hypothetical protein